MNAPVPIRTSELTVMTILPAKIIEADGRRFWHCPSCGKRLGEIVGERVVVKIGERWFTMKVQAQPDQGCGRCGTVSVVEAA
jgi:hypothetical protein